MRACINQATTMPTDFETDLRAYAAAGFRAVELWLDKAIAYTEKNGLAAAQRLLGELKLEPICACGQGGLLLAEGEERANALREFERRLKLGQALGAPKFIAYEGKPGKPTPELYDRVVANIQEIGAMAESYGVTLALEFIKGAQVLGSMFTMTQMVVRAARPNVGVLFDFFHFWAGISKMSDLEALPADKLAFVHVNDAPALPREMLADAHRVWLGQGCFPLREFRAHLLRLGYKDGVSIELFNRDVWAQAPYEAAKAAYRNVNDFIEGKL